MKTPEQQILPTKVRDLRAHDDRTRDVTWYLGVHWEADIDTYRFSVRPDGKSTTQPMDASGYLIGQSVVWPNLDEALSALGWERV